MIGGRGCDWGVWLEWAGDSGWELLERGRDGDRRGVVWVWVTVGWMESRLSFELLRWNADVCVAVFGWLTWIVWMKGWIRISSHLVDCRNGKKENGGVSVIDWADLPDWDLPQIRVWMWCGWSVAWFGVNFRRFGGNDHLLSFPRFWLNFHHFRWESSLGTAITLSRMPLNEI